MTEARFVSLLWIYVVLLLAASVAMFNPDYSDTLAAAYGNEPGFEFPGRPWLAAALLASLLFAWLAGLVGLFFFKRWARTLSLWLTMVGLLVTFFLGPVLATGAETALFDASSILWGAILALAYFSPASARFER